MGRRGRLGRRGSLAALCAALLVLTVAPSAHAFIYFNNLDQDTIGRASITGAGVQPNFFNAGVMPCGVAVDSQYVYFGNEYWGIAGSGLVGRATLDGQDVTAIAGGGSGTCGVGTTGNGVIFWTNVTGNTIGSGNNNGTGVIQNLISSPGASQPFQIAALGNNIYWDNLGSNTIWSSLFDGQNPAALLGEPVVNDPGGITATGDMIYWAFNAETSNGTILSSDLLGNPQGPVVSGINQLCGLATDGTYIYWGGNGVIGRAKLDGSDVDMNFADISGGPGPVPNPCSLAVDADTADGSVGPTSLDFGDLLVGSGPSTGQSVTLSNSTSTSIDLVPEAPGLTGPNADQYTISGDTCGSTVAPGASCTITVEFSPTSLGGAFANLTIPTNDPTDHTFKVPLAGTGTDPDESVAPSSIDFGNVLVDAQTTAKTVQLTNEATATAPDNVGQVTLTGDSSQFSIVDDGCSGTSVAVGDSCPVSVRFNPNVPGEAAASLNIPSDDPTSPAKVALTGTGTEPDEDVSPGALSFGDQLVGGQSQTQAVTVANSVDGTGPLNVGAVSIAGAGASQFDLVFEGCSEQSVSPGDDCQLGVRFKPTAAGAQGASVEIPSNGSSSPIAVPLTGSGMAIPATNSPAAPNCKALRHKLKKAKSKKKRKALRKKLRKRGC